jgi:hypothetical protein
MGFSALTGPGLSLTVELFALAVQRSGITTVCPRPSMPLSGSVKILV